MVDSVNQSNRPDLKNQSVQTNRPAMSFLFLYVNIFT